MSSSSLPRAPLKFIDIAVNLTDPMFKGIYRGNQHHVEDLEDVLQRSYDQGVEGILATGITLSSSIECIDIINKTNRRVMEGAITNIPQMYSTVGCHPTHCNEMDQYEDGGALGYIRELKNIIKKDDGKLIRAIGEIGLDYDRTEFCSKAVQKRNLKLLLSMAGEFNLPLFLHCRNAFEDLKDLLLKALPSLKCNERGVVHSFTGTASEAQWFIDQGFYISINGCSLRDEQNLQVARSLPKSKLMLETDSPWCDIRPTHVGFKYINPLPYISNKSKKLMKNSMVKSRNEPCTITNIFNVLMGDVLDYNERAAVASLILNNTNKVFNFRSSTNKN